jgi:hypothetical protein
MLESMQRRTNKCVRPSTNESCSIYYHAKDSDWETLAQRRTTAYLCALFKAYSLERAWKAIWTGCEGLTIKSRVGHVRKIRGRKQRTDIGKNSFVNRTIKNWNQLPAESFGIVPCKSKIFRKRVRKVIKNGMK